MYDPSETDELLVPLVECCTQLRKSGFTREEAVDFVRERFLQLHNIDENFEVAACVMG